MVAAVCSMTSYRITALPNNSSTFFQIKEEYPFIKKYHNAWPVNMPIRQFLGSHRNNTRAKMKACESTPADTTAGPSTAAPGRDLENDNPDEDESNVVVSGTDDD